MTNPVVESAVRMGSRRTRRRNFYFKL